MNGTSNAHDPYYTAVANENSVQLSTIPRENGNTMNSKTHVYEPPSDLYDYADVPQEQYEEVAQKEYAEVAPKEYAEVVKEEYAEVVLEEYAELEVDNKSTTEVSASNPSGGQTSSTVPPYAVVNKEEKRKSEHLYNYADVEASPRNSANVANTGNIQTGQEGWSECVIYDDCGDDDTPLVVSNQGNGEKGWVDNSIYDS